MYHTLPLMSALLAISAHAADIDLSSRVAPGKWALAYHRTGELKPIHYKRNEEGISYTCIDGDPREKILKWIKSKGCTIHEEKMVGDVYRMSGECELKWWRGNPIPVSVELRPEKGKKTFTLDIQTAGNSILGFTEHTRGTNIGPCDPQPAQTANVSAPQGKQDQDSQASGQAGK